MRQPLALFVAVFRLFVLDKISVPAPSFQIVLVPAMVEPIVATPESTVMWDGTPPRLSVPEVTAYPEVLNVIWLTMITSKVGSETEPAVPQKTASLPTIQA